MLVTILVATAFAQPPQVTVTEHGTVRGRVVVPASLDTVRDTLDHSAGRIAAVANGAEVEATADGSCELEHTYMPHPIKSVTYTLRTCPTEQGFHSVLVDSHDLERFEAIWELSATDEGTVVTYDLDLKPSFPLPGFVVRASAKKGVLDAMLGLERAFAR